MITGLLNFHFTSTIQFYDFFNGFWSGCGTGTAALKTNLLQYITSMREAVIYEIFLDLQKLYNTLDRDKRLEIIAAYGVVPRELFILQTYRSRIPW